jgi:hypothetical protein
MEIPKNGSWVQVSAAITGHLVNAPQQISLQRWRLSILLPIGG